MITSRKYTVYNLEDGMPSWEEAERRLANKLNDARKTGIKVVKIIHGYGSSGTGGKLRAEVRRWLSDRKKRRTITDYIPGEEFYSSSARLKTVFDDLPWLKDDSDNNANNSGITIVIL